MVNALKLGFARCDAGGDDDFIKTFCGEQRAIDACIQTQRDAVFGQHALVVTQSFMKFFFARYAFGQVELAADLCCTVK